MSSLLVNCDLGERGTDHPTDLAIMPLVHVANIACGGHAGGAESVRFFEDLAEQHDVIVCAHPSYPDRENFGRTSMDIAHSDLCSSLDRQLELFTEPALVKLHGALYNDACRDEELAGVLAQWLAERGVSRVITQEGAALALAGAAAGLTIVREFFAERRYTVTEHGVLSLVPRTRPYASIHDCSEALEQARLFAEQQIVRVVLSENADGSLNTEEHAVRAETVCVHSDSPIALELIKGMAALGLGRETD